MITLLSFNLYFNKRLPLSHFEGGGELFSKKIAHRGMRHLFINPVLIIVILLIAGC